MKQIYFVSFIVLSLLVLAGCAGNTREAPRAVDGVLDLGSWDFKKDGSLDLNGEWAFYWQQLLAPEAFVSGRQPSPTGFFTIPGCWNRYSLDGNPLGGDGFATFRLKVRIPPDEMPRAVRILNQSSAYALWINGKIVARNGVVGTGPDTVTPQYLLQEVPFFEEGPELDIILQVANFNHRRGGVWNPIRMGTATRIKSRENLQWIFDLFLFGSLLIMGVYHFSLYLLRREDPSALFFAVLTLDLAVRVLVCGNYYLTLMFPHMPWELLYKIELLSVVIPLPVLLLFIASIFNRQIFTGVVYLFTGIGGVFSLIVILTPARISCHLVPLNQAVILLAIAYILSVLARALIQGEKGAGIVLAGMALFGTTAVLDILNANRILYTIQLAPFGVFCLIFSQSFVLSSRFARAFRQVKKLSMELEKKNKELRRMDQIRDEFLANTSHELRTPLNGIIGIAESLIDGAAGRLSEKAMVNLSLIFSSARRLAGLVNDILDFSRLKNSDVKLTIKTVDIKPLIHGVLCVTGTMAGNKGLELSESVPENIPFVMGDENRLQQILYNLIGNAVKFTEQGHVRVGAAQKGSMVEIWVSDTGSGIPEDQLDTVFQAFEQVDSAPSRQFEGTGLGLSITRHLVGLHGGDIRVESTVGKGSRFYFTIPVGTGRPDAESLREISGISHALSEKHMVRGGDLQPPIRNPQFTSSCQVFVVDDDPVNLQVVANHLSLESISFSTASDGMEALNRIESGEKPHMVLLDIMMPKITGYEVCRRLRERYSPSELPVIMLTAKSHVADLVEAYRAGANDYLSKPFSKDELMARVNCHLGLKEAYETLKENRRLESEVEQQKQKKERARLREEKARIEMLRYQLNPHFLFNALASIRGAIPAEGEAARRMVSHLAEFSRQALSRKTLDYQTVSREIAIIRHYLKMEAMRFEDYLTVSIDVEPAAEKIEIPALIIHPLVENAIKYGSLTSPDLLEVRITAQLLKPDRLGLRVSNTGTWGGPGTAGTGRSTGIGLENVRQRLATRYSGDFRFETFEGNGWVNSEITVPVKMTA